MKEICISIGNQLDKMIVDCKIIWYINYMKEIFKSYKYRMMNIKY